MAVEYLQVLGLLSHDEGSEREEAWRKSGSRKEWEQKGPSKGRESISEEVRIIMRMFRNYHTFGTKRSFRIGALR